jgi:CBS domain containing-hemolysin-like protein
VYEGSIDTIVGIAHTRDVAVRVLQLQGEGAPLPADLLRATMRPPLQVPETLRADRLLALLREHRTQMAVVIDEMGGVAGLINLDDVLKELLGRVPAARSGELAPQRLPDGRLVLPGRMRLHEAEPWIGVAWSGEADTVGGHVVEALGHLPEPGERVTIDGVEVEVLEVRHRAVAAAAVRPVGRAGRRPGEGNS